MYINLNKGYFPGFIWHLSLSLSLSLSIFIYLFVYLFNYLIICLFIHAFIYLSILYDAKERLNVTFLRLIQGFFFLFHRIVEAVILGFLERHL